MSGGLSWLSIIRLGLAQTSLGAIVVLLDSTFNRVMVVELGLAAIVPGFLMGLYYAIQLSRPRWGYGSDMGGRRTPWIIGGMALLGAGAVGAAGAIMVMETMTGLGLGLAAVAFVAVGVGVGAAGTSILALTAKYAAPRRRGPAATILWVMMIIGFIVTAASVGNLLDPFSMGRLLEVTAAVAIIALLLTIFAVSGVERNLVATHDTDASPDSARKPAFRAVMAEIWQERSARLFTIFVFLSMLAYGAQDLILEPFAAKVFGLTVGETTKMTATQYQGALLGMILTGIANRFERFGSLVHWTVGGCIASGLALVGLSVSGAVGPAWPLTLNIFLLGLANGVFAIAAIGSMMERAGTGAASREGVRMGLWGAAQGMAMGAGKVLGAAGVDGFRLTIGNPIAAYQTVFFLEGLLFCAAAMLCLAIEPAREGPAPMPRLKPSPQTQPDPT